MAHNVWLKLGNLEEDGKKCDGLNYRAKCVGQTPDFGRVRPSVSAEALCVGAG